VGFARVSILVSVSIVLLGVTLAAAAANPASTHLDNLAGTWHCTYRSEGKILNLVATGTRLNDNWIQLKSARGITLATYDASRKQWVQFGANSRGDYTLATADDSPTAASLTWRVRYPANMQGGMSTISWPSSTKRVIKSMAVQNGKHIETDGVCTK
jgi:hypothetical protein